jgi:hypothetical protein
MHVDKSRKKQGCFSKDEWAGAIRDIFVSQCMMMQVRMHLIVLQGLPVSVHST